MRLSSSALSLRVRQMMRIFSSPSVFPSTSRNVHPSPTVQVLGLPFSCSRPSPSRLQEGPFHVLPGLGNEVISSSRRHGNRRLLQLEAQFLIIERGNPWPILLLGRYAFRNLCASSITTRSHGISRALSFLPVAKFTETMTIPSC